MKSTGRALLPWCLVGMLLALAFALFPGVAVAQKSGGILKIPHGDSPASMSILEESTIVSEGPMMAVFNNLVMFDQHIAQNRSIRSSPTWPPDGRGARTARC